MFKGGMGNIMRQAQKMQENVQKVQDEIASLEVEGQSGAGLVKITMTGRHDVKRVQIDDSLFGDDKEILEDLIAAAVNDAVRNIESTQKSKMDAATEGMPLPPGFKMPF